jgi:hypothetical protein
MTVEMSKLEQLRAAAVAHAADRIVSTLKAQGVEEAKALAFCENHVTLMIAPNLKVHAEVDSRRSRGSSDEALSYFAREIHLFHPELGGKPVPFGFAAPPVNDEVATQAERVAVGRAEAETARQRLRAQDEETARLLQTTGVAGSYRVAEQEADARRAF